MMSDELTAKMKRASALLMHCKRHQVFREKPEEAIKMAEAGKLYAEIALELRNENPTASSLNYETAQVCLARAKRLCRDLVRDQPKKKQPRSDL